MDKISINIWDDYHDDGYVPEGKIQETYAYVECDLESDDCKNVLALLQSEIAQLSSCPLELRYYDSAQKYPQFVGTDNEMFLYKRWQLEIKHISHTEREALVEKLEGKLTYKDTPVVVYSES